VWFQLKITHCPGDQIEALSSYLEEYGALSIMLTDKNDHPVLEPAPGTTPLWPEVVVQALFDNEEQLLLAQADLTNSIPSLQFTMEILADQDWERAWMDDFKPQRFGQRLWICPSWHTPPDLNAINLILDPGLAFGTGTHATTSLCLTWLEQADLADKTVIDFGCGSGILSLAAIKLGAKQVQAVDIDEQALQATASNATINNISDKQLLVSSPEVLHKPADILIANILLDPLINLKNRFRQLMNKKGLLVVSGLLEEQMSTLIATYSPELSVLNQQISAGWGLLVFCNNE
jgi:ribosomal protein L11 methyltransferase